MRAEPESQDQARLDYLVADHRCRAPRAVIVFEATPTWWENAREAVAIATTTWGGAGFIYAPHANGKIHPAVAAAAIAYDPDYVVAVAGSPSGKGTMEARGRLAAMCGVYRDAGLLDAARLISAPPGYPFARVEHVLSAQGAAQPRDFHTVRLPATRLSAPSLPAPLGALLAAVYGVIEAIPVPDSVGDLTAEAIEDLANSALTGHTTGAASRMLSHYFSDRLPSVDIRSWGDTLIGIEALWRVSSPLDTYVVLGDTADDWALAIALDRMGSAKWVPSSIYPDWSTPSFKDAMQTVGYAALQRPPAAMKLTSATEGQPALSSKAETLRSIVSQDCLNEQRPVQDFVSSEPVEWDQLYGPIFAVSGTHGDRSLVPARFQHGGDWSLVADLSLPPTLPAPLSSLPHFHCEVDFDPEEATCPLGRGLHETTLLASADTSPSTSHCGLRSTRRGISYHRVRRLMISNSPEPYDLSTPRLASPGLLSWVRTMAASGSRSESFDVRFSGTGKDEERAATLFGSRQTAAAFFSGPWLSVFKAFKTDKSTYDKDRCRIDSDSSCLTFNGVNGRLDGAAKDQARATLDSLLQQGVMSRGLVLQCAHCGDLEFYRIEQIGTSYNCTSCGQPNSLIQASWRHPPEEPTWFYSLHPVVKRIASGHGTTEPFQLAAYLRSTSESYTDLSALELIPTGNQDGKATCEVDLLANSDNQIILAEVKSGHPRHLEDEVEKLAKIGALLRADRLLLALTESRELSKQNVADRLRAAPWRTLTPTVEVISRLGASDQEHTTIYRGGDFFDSQL